MSVVAYDGKYLASDRMMSGECDSYAVCKLFEAHNTIWGVVGNGYHSQELKAWIIAGCDPASFPACQRGDGYAVALGVERSSGRVIELGKSPWPIEVLSLPVAIGSGQDYAKAAMLLGLTAIQAVEFTNKHVYSCGEGVDYERVRESGN